MDQPRWTPLAVGLISRLGLVVLTYLALVFIHTQADSVLAPPRNLLVDGWARWDSAAYLSIARDGYTDQSPTRFFPLYPWLVKGVSLLTGNYLVAALLVSNLAFLLALQFVYALVRERFGGPVALRTILLLCLYPFSFYLSAVYSDSLLLATTAGAFLLAQRKNWLGATLCAALAGLTQLPGLLVAPALALVYLEKRAFKPMLGLGLAGLLPAVYAWQVWAPFVDPPLARPQLPLAPTAWLVGLLHAALFALALVSCVLAWSRVGRAWALWSLAHLLAGLLAWNSMGRQLCVLFPVFVLWARMLPEPVFLAAAYLSTLLLALLAWVFATFSWTFIG